MRGHVIHLKRIATACFVACAATWLVFGSTADAAAARAELKNAAGERVGEASLQDTAEGVKVSATFIDLPPGQHAFHVHAVGRCEPPFDSAGGHFNPTGRQHGRDNPQGPHAGDMPNIELSDRTAPSIEIVLKDTTLDRGPNRLLDADGASLVVHERADDYVTDPAGNVCYAHGLKFLPAISTRARRSYTRKAPTAPRGHPARPDPGRCLRSPTSGRSRRRAREGPGIGARPRR